MAGYTIDGNMYKLPVLETTNVTGKKMYWEAHVIDDTFYRKSWQEGGKIREFPPTVCKGKNIGKSNETTGHQQALSECKKKWLDQTSKGYVVAGDSNVKIELKLLPMLAQKFTDRKKYIQYPCAVSRKLDGIRMLSSFKTGEIVLTSRTSKPFMYVEKIRQHIKSIYNVFGYDLILDGELYSHNLPFSVISGAIRSTKQKSESDDLLEYWIFDIVDTTRPYKTRAQILKDIQDWYVDKYLPGERVLQFELYELVEKESELVKYHDEYVKDGFEGLIIRNLEGKYLLEKRSNDLQKYKSFEDAEFEIVGFKLGVGTEEGAIVFTCKCGESTFDVRPRGSIGDRIEKAKRGDSFIGKKLTVRYQPSVKQSDVDKNELPRFPIGIEVRDYE
jgi:ATP-dependent DNA ligase